MPAERKWLLQEPEGMFNRSSKSSDCALLSKLRTHVLSGAVFVFVFSGSVSVRYRFMS